MAIVSYMQPSWKAKGLCFVLHTTEFISSTNNKNADLAFIFLLVASSSNLLMSWRFRNKLYSFASMYKTSTHIPILFCWADS
jgi:hypothetical protein